VSPRSWVFLAAKPFLPAEGDPFAAGLGGTEQAIIHLSTALAALGDRVTVAGATTTARTLGGVEWTPLPPPSADTAVAINDARLLPAGAANSTIWFHNEVAIAKEFRRRRLPALLRQRPTAIFIGTEQARTASRLLPFRRRLIIPYGLSDRVLAAPTASTTPPPAALFTSQAYRGLAPVIDTWQRHVAPTNQAATLTAYIADADLLTYQALATDRSITIAPRIGNDAILVRLRQTRLLVAPGHRSETFCLAAAEAIALGVPVVTLGIGSLKERIRHGIDGFICPDYETLGARTRDLLADDFLWHKFHQAALATREIQSWKTIARIWQTQAGVSA
jgi:hypothetical protein